MFPPVIATLITCILEIPFIITLYRLTKYYTNYPSKSIVYLYIFIGSIGLWIISGYSWLADTEIMINGVPFFNTLGILSAQITFILFSYVYTNFESQWIVSRLSYLAFICFSNMLLLFLIDTFVLDTELIYLQQIGNRVFTNYHPVILILYVVGNATLILVIILNMLYQHSISSKIVSMKMKKNNLIALTLIIVATVLSFVYTLGIGILSDYIVGILGVSNRFFLATACLLLALEIARSPLFILNMSGNVQSLIDKGIVGYYVISLKDNQLAIINHSSSFVERFEISKADHTAFSTACMTTIGIQSSFHQSTFLIPYPQHSELVGMCFSFFHNDPSLLDKRLKQQSLSVFAITIPSLLLQKTGSLVHVDRWVFNLKERTTSIQAFSQDKNIHQLTNNILKEII